MSVALLTCFNRKDITLSCLESIYAQSLVKDLELSIYLVDDGSSDGTYEAVTKKFPDVKVLKGDGCLYWNGGMNMAWSAAYDAGFDYYLWVNDDVALQPDAFKLMFDSLHKACSNCDTEPVIVGSFCESVGCLYKANSPEWNYS